MTTTEKLKADIEAFCEAHGMSAAKFSQLSVGDAAFWFKFSRGRVPTLDTYDRITSFMDSYNADNAA